MNNYADSDFLETITRHSKSFSLASKLLPADVRPDVLVLYHWCRRADDSVDNSRGLDQINALAALRQELDSVFAGEEQSDAGLAAFQQVINKHIIPKHYFEELLNGLMMDSTGYRYHTEDDLMLYCFRVAGTVGLMMSHVLGIRDEKALRYAAELGMAMQLTNISRDIMEDWERERLYIPSELLDRYGIRELNPEEQGDFPPQHLGQIRYAVRDLLELAGKKYRKGNGGLKYLSWKAAFAVRTASLVYSGIGSVIERKGFAVNAGRAYVGKGSKLLLVGKAFCYSIGEIPERLRNRFTRADICHVYSLKNSMLTPRYYPGMHRHRRQVN